MQDGQLRVSFGKTATQISHGLHDHGSEQFLTFHRHTGGHGSFDLGDLFVAPFDQPAALRGETGAKYSAMVRVGSALQQLFLLQIEQGFVHRLRRNVRATRQLSA